MAKLNNKGFSLVELIIAIAVFTFMIIPVISQLMVSMRIGDRSRAMQENSEYAEYLMEYFKSTPLEDIGKDNLFDGDNKIELKTAETKKSVTVNGTIVEYSEIVYQIPQTSPVTIGKKEYYSTIRLDTKEYALTEAGYRSATATEIADTSVTKYEDGDGNKYVSIAAMEDPNQVNVGHLTNLDSKAVAIIDGDASNSDKTASDAIFAMKSESMKNGTPDDYKKWEQLMYGNYSGFDNDEVKKITRIKVSKGTASGKTAYTVKVTVSYQDSNTEYPTYLPPYTVMHKTFVKDEPPVIYYMYNPCVYNAEYMTDDYVVLDTSEAGGADIKMYMIETLASIPANIKAVMDENSIPYDSENLIEYVNTSANRVKRENIVTHVNVNGDTSKMQIFTNKDLNRINDYDGFANNISSEPANTAPGSISGSIVTHFVKPLSEDSEFEGRLYTVTVTLYNAASNSEVATFTGTKGVN